MNAMTNHFVLDMIRLSFRLLMNVGVIFCQNILRGLQVAILKAFNGH